MADITVNAGQSLQTAINNAVGGDRIICQKGATFVGPFAMPSKASEVTITSSSVLDGLLPSRRILPSDAAQLATITAHNSNWCVDGAGASNWTWDGLRCAPVTGFNNGYFDYTGETNNNTIFKRIFFEGTLGEQKRFIRVDGRNTLVKWCYIDDLHKPGTDGQGISIIKGRGPHTIQDNWIRGGSECILIGGAGSSEAEIPSDGLIEENDLSQVIGRYPVTHLTKNLFEMKNGKRWIFRYNRLKDIRDGAQASTAIMLTPQNQTADSPWTRIYDVLIEHNSIKNAGRGLVVLGYGYSGDGLTEANKHLYTTMQTNLIVVRHNLFELYDERFLQFAAEADTVTAEHNTVIIANGQPDPLSIYFAPDGGCLRSDGPIGLQTYAVKSLTLKDNMIQGRVLSGVAHGIVPNTRSDVAQTFVTSNNVFGLVDPPNWPTQYGSNTRITESAYEGSFEDTEDYLLDSLSPYNNAASDGGDIGWEGQGGDSAPVGEANIVWTSLTGTASATGPDISGGPSSGGLSTQSLTGEGYFEFTDAAGTGECYIGLGTNAAYDTGMSHAFELGAVVGIRESGTYRADFPRITGAVYRIQVTGTTVTYYQNEALKYTSLVPVTLPKKLDVGFLSGGGSVADAVISIAQENTAPVVSAGPDRTITLGQTASLSGSVSDDGLPATGTLTRTWSKQSGPGVVTFANTTAASTTATLSLIGTYVLRLTASDGEFTVYDEMKVVVTPPVGSALGRPRIFHGTSEITGKVRL